MIAPAHVLSFVLAMAAVGAPGPGDDAVLAAKAAVARRLNVSEERIHLVDVAAQRWSDASLGCPRKEELYAQVMTEGHRVRLRVDDRTFDVRVAAGHALLCESAETAATQAAAAARLSRLARRDLAGRLGIAEAEVRVEFVRAKAWPDAGLDCAATAVAPSAAGAVRGYALELSAGGRRYEYRADAERVRFCERP